MLPSCFKQLAQTITLSTALLAASNAFAQDGPFFGKEATGKWIIGAKFANIDPQEPNTQDTNGIGVVLGYEFDKTIYGGTSSFEVEYIQSDDEDVTLLNGVERFGVNQDPIIGTYEATVVNAFFNYRSAGDLYFKLKAGLSYIDLDFDYNFRGFQFENQNSEDTSLAAGIGLGYRLGDSGMIEVDYYKDSGNADTGIASINALLTF